MAPDDKDGNERAENGFAEVCEAIVNPFESRMTVYQPFGNFENDHGAYAHSVNEVLSCPILYEHVAILTFFRRVLIAPPKMTNRNRLTKPALKKRKTTFLTRIKTIFRSKLKRMPLRKPRPKQLCLLRSMPTILWVSVGTITQNCFLG